MSDFPNKFYPNRIWRGYATNLVRPVMPLAKFFYGNTHKWYFRTTATALAATFIAAINLRFVGDARWVSYLSAFGAISLVYWGLYAPAKWATKDCVLNPSEYREGKVNFIEFLASVPMQSVIFEGGHEGATSTPPPEVALLAQYIQPGGQFREVGPYRYAREWHPPNCWAGRTEFDSLMETAAINWEICLEKLGHNRDDFPGYTNKWNNEKRNSIHLLKTVAYLDAFYPEWREQARAWNEGRTRLLRWQLRRLWNPTRWRMFTGSI